MTPQTAASSLAALVVTHDRLGQLRLTLSRLLEEPIDHLVVVDNASRDGTEAYLASLTDPRLRVIRASANLGGAGGVELGLRAITQEIDPDWCVLMDDDARPAPGALARFRAEAARAGGFEALAAGVFYPDGEICEMNRPSRNPFWNLGAFLRTSLGGGRGGFHLKDADYRSQGALPIDACSFVGFFLSRRAIARAGLPDGKLFLYGDDVIYTLRLSRAGGAIGFAPWIRFEHDCTTLNRGTDYVHRPLWKAYYNYRNGLLAYRIAAGPLLIWPVLLVVVPKWLLKSRLYRDDRGTYLRLLRLAVLDALAGRLGRSHDEVVARSSGNGLLPPQA